MNQGRLSEAEPVLRDAWEEWEDDGRIPTNLGAVLLKTDRISESLPVLRSAVELFPEFAGAWINHQPET